MADNKSPGRALATVQDWWQDLKTRFRPTTTSKSTAKPQVQLRSPTLRQREAQVDYQTCQDAKIVGRFIENLAEELNELVQRQQHKTQEKVWLLRLGTLPQKMRYLYLQRLNEDGWLFEQHPSGWIVTKATFVAANATFLRARDSWDRVVLLQAAQNPTSFRLRSERYGPDHLSYYIYRELIASGLGLQGELQ